VVSGALTEVDDPVRWLSQVRQVMQPDDCLLVGVPNVTHGTMRLALLAGQSPHVASSLVGQAERRFFTVDSLLDCLDEAGFVLGATDRIEAPIDGDEAALGRLGVLPSVASTLARDPDARTAIMLAVAYPLPRPELRFVQERMRAQALTIERLQREMQALQDAPGIDRVSDLERITQEQAEHIDGLTARLEAAARRESDLRNRLIDAHDQLLRRDDDLRFRWFEQRRQIKVPSVAVGLPRFSAALTNGDSLYEFVYLRLQNVYARLQWVPGIRLPVVLYRRLRGHDSPY
jgi:hypothetical protein